VSDGVPVGARATLARVGAESIISIAAGLSIGERRFAIAHEIAHLLMHAMQSSLGLCTGEDMATTDDERFRLEVEASDCATHVLMPVAIARQFCGETNPWHGIRAMADELLVSTPAAARRFIELSDRPAALVYQVEGRVKWVHPSAAFPGFIPRKRSVRRESPAFGFWNQGACSNDGAVVPARVWIPSAEEGATLVEHAIASPEFGSAMSIVSLPSPLPAEL